MDNKWCGRVDCFKQPRAARVNSCRNIWDAIGESILVLDLGFSMGNLIVHVVPKPPVTVRTTICSEFSCYGFPMLKLD